MLFYTVNFGAFCNSRRLSLPGSSRQSMTTARGNVAPSLIMDAPTSAGMTRMGGPKGYRRCRKSLLCSR